MKIKLKIIAVGFVLFGNTTEGFGRDLEKGGQNIQKAATDNSDT